MPARHHETHEHRLGLGGNKRGGQQRGSEQAGDGEHLRGERASGDAGRR